MSRVLLISLTVWMHDALCPRDKQQQQWKHKEEIGIWNGKYKMFQMIALNIEENKVDHNDNFTDENVQCIPFSKQNYMLMYLLSIILLLWHPGNLSFWSHTPCSRTKIKTVTHCFLVVVGNEPLGQNGHCYHKWLLSHLELGL